MSECSISRIVNVASINCSETLCKGAIDRIWHLSWSNCGKYLATCGEDKLIRVWSFYIDDSSIDKPLKCIAVLEEGQSRTLRSCEWSPDSSMIASASFDGTVIVWQSINNQYREWEQLSSLEGHESEVKSLSWSYDGGYLATCGRDKKIWIWEKLRDGEFDCISVVSCDDELAFVIS